MKKKEAILELLDLFILVKTYVTRVCEGFLFAKNQR